MNPQVKGMPVQPMSQCSTLNTYDASYVWEQEMVIDSNTNQKAQGNTMPCETEGDAMAYSLLQRSDFYLSLISSSAGMLHSL